MFWCCSNISYNPYESLLITSPSSQFVHSKVPTYAIPWSPQQQPPAAALPKAHDHPLNAGNVYLSTYIIQFMYDWSDMICMNHD